MAGRRLTLKYISEMSFKKFLWRFFRFSWQNLGFAEGLYRKVREGTDPSRMHWWWLIVSGFMCHCCISWSKLVAVIQCWPFSHALIVALYVIASGFMCHCCTFRSKLVTMTHWRPLLRELLVELYVISECAHICVMCVCASLCTCVMLSSFCWVWASLSNSNASLHKLRCPCWTISAAIRLHFASELDHTVDSSLRIARGGLRSRCDVIHKGVGPLADYTFFFLALGLQYDTIPLAFWMFS